jgi:hypothetical protein
MNKKEFEKLVNRDQYCLHCGETVMISPQHRVNRQMGGSKARHTPDNLIVLCSLMNGLIESNSEARTQALKYGWKVASWDNPKEIPVFDGVAGVWYLLDENYGRKVSTAT